MVAPTGTPSACPPPPNACSQAPDMRSLRRSVRARAPRAWGRRSLGSRREAGSRFIECAPRAHAAPSAWHPSLGPRRVPGLRLSAHAPRRASRGPRVLPRAHVTEPAPVGLGPGHSPRTQETLMPRASLTSRSSTHRQYKPHFGSRSPRFLRRERTPITPIPVIKLSAFRNDRRDDRHSRDPRRPSLP